MIVTTTHAIEGRKISAYLGVIAGEAIMVVNAFKDFFAGIRDSVGRRSGAYEQELQKARDAAFADLTARADDLGADAVVGIDIDIDYAVISGGSSSMLMVSVSGTAVKLA